MLIDNIESKLNPLELYSAFYKDNYSFFLDSTCYFNTSGRFSFIASNPFLIFKCKDRYCEVIINGNNQITQDNPFYILKELLKEYRIKNKSFIPFIGGAVGYFSYELYKYLENIPIKGINDFNIPDIFLGFYDGILAIDNLTNKKYIVSLGIAANQRLSNIYIKDKIKNREKIEKIMGSEKIEKVSIKSNFTKTEYLLAIDKIRHYIREGEIYQANLTQRFEGNISVSPYHLYSKIRDISPTPFGVVFNFGECSILCNSPERFLKINDKNIESRPIKGTRPRGKTDKEDNQYVKDLISSEKDKAELTMIIDVVRNDLNRVSKTGTVKVNELFCAEKYSNVHHLVSTIIGKLSDKYDEIDCIMSSFPGASITGAPKIRAIEIINEIEPNTRNIYTGAIGYIGFNKNIDLNIAIRTMIIKNQKVYFNVGGGIVWDSVPEDEYQETIYKASSIMKALNIIETD